MEREIRRLCVLVGRVFSGSVFITWIAELGLESSIVVLEKPNIVERELTLGLYDSDELELCGRRVRWMMI
jgi:hypothetical protein